jgi:hypothetical protein
VSATQEALFTVGPVSDLTHVLMPCMGYACGGDIVTKGGHFVFDPVGERGKVTCPECRALDPDDLRAERDRQQGRQA